MENKERSIRTLKIQPRIRTRKWEEPVSFPEIKLSGSWLEKLGFHYGKTVCVTSVEGMLIIKLDNEESMPAGDLARHNN